MKSKKLTLSLAPEVAIWLRNKAAQNKTTVSKIIKAVLREKFERKLAQSKGGEG